LGSTAKGSTTGYRRFSSPVGAASSKQEKEPTPTGTATATVEEPVLFNKKKLKKELEDLPVDYSDISRARLAIQGGVRRTDCFKSYFLSELIGANIYLKPEFQQFTGSFKERGARNAILNLMREKGSSLRGVIAASAGNHALALAYHGRELGVPVTVVMPKVAPLAKVDKCRVSPHSDTRKGIYGTFLSLDGGTRRNSMHASSSKEHI
jgi:threonine dehydratase